MTGLTCISCVHRYEGLDGPECRRNPPTIIWSKWAAPKLMEEASTQELRDRRNWEIVSAFPDALAHCGDFVHQVHGL
jgi:hypothetical protein